MQATDEEPAVDPPAFEFFVKDRQLSRIGIFAACFLTIGVFYLAVVKLPVSSAFPTQQLQKLGTTLTLTSPTPALDLASGVGVGAAAQARNQPVATLTPLPTATPLPVVVPPPPTATPTTPNHAAAAPTPASSQSYVVKDGDTLFSIARRYNVSVKQLAASNRLADVTLVKVGQTLQVP
ncbi:MAG: LysM peptidoglycan-binding domain-containing protein [Chloroflexota bacterium]